jgi:hypothetical protein
MQAASYSFDLFTLQTEPKNPTHRKNNICMLPSEAPHMPFSDLSGVGWLGRRVLSSQAKSCRGLQECQPLELTVPQAAPSTLDQQGPPLPLHRFPRDWLLGLVIRFLTIREFHNANIRT